MGLLDKLKFWKKDEEFTLDKAGIPELPPEPGSPPQDVGAWGPQTPHPEPLAPLPPGPAGMPERRLPPMEASVHPAMTGPSAERDLHKDLELINAKLDALRATVDNINQRLERMERGTEKEVVTLPSRWR